MKLKNKRSKFILKEHLNEIEKITKKETIDNLHLWIAQLEHDEIEIIEDLLMQLHKENKRTHWEKITKEIKKTEIWIDDIKETLNNYLGLDNELEDKAKQILQQVNEINEKVQKEKIRMEKTFDRYLKDFIHTILIEINRNFMWLDFFNTDEMKDEDWIQIWHITKIQIGLTITDQGKKN